jgi:hypothetical protein
MKKSAILLAISIISISCIAQDKIELQSINKSFTEKS